MQYQPIKTQANTAIVYANFLGLGYWLTITFLPYIYCCIEYSSNLLNLLSTQVEVELFNRANMYLVLCVSPQELYGFSLVKASSCFCDVICVSCIPLIFRVVSIR